MGTCLHAGTTGSSPVSWTIRTGAGPRGGSGGGPPGGGGLSSALPSRPGELWFLSACAHTALAGLADQAGSGVSAAEAASEAETAVARLHQAVAMGYRNADAPATRTPWH